MTIFSNRRLLRIVAAVTLAVTLVVGITVVATPWWKGFSRNVYTAYFPNTNGLYTGDEVRILGVAVGTVEQIEPQRNATKVTFSVDSQYPIPADAKAAILSPTLVSARPRRPAHASRLHRAHPRRHGAADLLHARDGAMDSRRPAGRRVPALKNLVTTR